MRPTFCISTASRARHRRARRRRVVAPSSSDQEVVSQREDAATILFPDEVKPTTRCRAEVELKIGIGSHGLIHVDAEYHLVVVAADKLVDDLARNHLAAAVTAQSRFHLMFDQGLDLNNLALRCGAGHLHAWSRGGHFPPPFYVRRTRWYQPRPRFWSSEAYRHSFRRPPEHLAVGPGGCVSTPGVRCAAERNERSRQ